MQTFPSCGAYLQPFRKKFDVKCWNCRLDLSGYEYVRSSWRQGGLYQEEAPPQETPYEAVARGMVSAS